jgi:CheY-like chemotaxis protein
MSRPCFVILDREFSGNISTRKLIIETAKFNVITAYSGSEAIELAERFPEVDAAVLDGDVRDMPVEAVAKRIKQLKPRMPIILICAPNNLICPDADYQLDFFDPAALLKLLQKLFPQETAEIQARNVQLNKESQ